MIYINTETLDNSCGVSLFHGFLKGYKGYYKSPIATAEIGGGAGLVCAMFVVGDSVSDEAKADMEKRFKLLYATPPKINRNTGNWVVFAVYECDEDENYGFENHDDDEEDDEDL